MNLLTLDQTLENLKEEIRGKQIILFTDFDGTLLPMPSEPKTAFLSEETKTLLSVLSRTMPVTIISGRSVKDLKEKVPIPEINLAGNHGLEIVGPVGFYLNPDAVYSYPVMTEVSALLNGAFVTERGIVLEDKGLTLSVHYNIIPDVRHSDIVKAVSLFLRPFLDDHEVKVTEGKNVLEIRPPSNWGKSEAIRWILERYKSINPQKEYFPLYVGDNASDMNAFSSMNRQGFSIWFGDVRARVNATALASSSKEMVDFLYRLNSFLKEG